MLKAISTYIYVKERLHPGLLDKLVSGGAQAIEIFGARQHLDYANRKQHVREIADWFRFIPSTLRYSRTMNGDAPARRLSTSPPLTAPRALKPWTRSSARLNWQSRFRFVF